MSETKPESETPRTDLFASQVHKGTCLPSCDKFGHDEKCPVAFGEQLIADFARTLERENASLLERNDLVAVTVLKKKRRNQ